MPRTSSKSWDKWGDEQRDHNHSRSADRECQRKAQQMRLRTEQKLAALIEKRNAKKHKQKLG